MSPRMQQGYIPYSNEILQGKHQTDIIVYLYINGARTKSEIYAAVSTNPRMSEKLDILCRRGIIREIRTYSRQMYGLTHMGFEYARLLCYLEEVSGGDMAAMFRRHSGQDGIVIQRI